MTPSNIKHLPGTVIHCKGWIQEAAYADAVE